MSQLAAPWDVVVDGILILALMVGACAALTLLSTAHGWPWLVDQTTLRSAGVARVTCRHDGG